MAIDIPGIFDTLVSYAGRLSIFEQVVTHDPKASPSTGGITCSITFRNMRPVPSSGLASTTLRVEFSAVIFTGMLQEPQDDIDPMILDAATQLLTALAGGFTMGGLVRHVDLFGSDGEPLNAEAGYLSQDGKIFRIIDITIPVIVNDVSDEVP